MLRSKEDLLKVLESMSRFETAISGFYQECGLKWKEEQAFWSTLATAEIRHASHVKKMADIISDKPERFEAGRPFNVVALGTAMSAIESRSREVRAGNLSRREMLFIARDTELSILEQRYSEVVRTDDVEYQTLVGKILRDTAEHKQMLDRKIEELRKSGQI